jgi:hypothetical protein
MIFRVGIFYVRGGIFIPSGESAATPMTPRLPANEEGTVTDGWQ